MKTLPIILIVLNCQILMLTMLSFGCMIIENNHLNIYTAFAHHVFNDGQGNSF